MECRSRCYRISPAPSKLTQQHANPSPAMATFLFTSDCDMRAADSPYRRSLHKLTSLCIPAFWASEQERERDRAVQIRGFSQAGSPDSQISQSKQRRLTEMCRGGKGRAERLDGFAQNSFIWAFEPRHVLLICCEENRKRCSTCYVTFRPGSC